ncbi:integrase core domain-containing protein [Insolitispirillum peregrinum]|uniref:Transposase InsO and inactivated derivatives n=1 Tax=Insolitispirillum peregrinum TaxID=80876 RepID=A0A1N7JQT7_9PROT|nr:integrase core domain-containing protein [Insolitispirillum peregrinum]SIS51621.1 Transposase InsO and inactivated derivatives [Insolitispirillum peregrinum]
MPFTEKTVMDDRLCFISACLRAAEPMSRICSHYGISRKTGYKWLSRYRADGVAGLEERSRAPKTVGSRIDEEQSEKILALKSSHRTWGPRKILAKLARDYPERQWPAVSTVGDFLSRHDLTSPRQGRRASPASSGPIIEAVSANDSWSADFKGWFRTGDGVRCEPLTISDNYSRFLLVCHAVPRLTDEDIRPLFIDCFRQYGLPTALRTDNGAPFAHHFGLGGLSRFSVWLLKLDVWPDRITPGCPTQNGRHERMHRTLAEDTAQPPADTLALQQERLDQWRRIYNTERPHQGIGDKYPADLFSPSPRAYPEIIRPWDYPVDHLVLKVKRKGYIDFGGEAIYLSEAFNGEHVGIATMDDGRSVIRFRGFDLAYIDQGGKKVCCSGLARSGQTGT